MCRLLLVKTEREFDIQERLAPFAEIARNSKEFQGHGWGCAYLRDARWEIYKNILPIWDDDLSRFGRTRLLLGHARSAFKDEGIAVENNMPFFDGRYVFIFNGELRGVRISEKGRIGAERVFNHIKRFDRGDMLQALTKGTEVIEKRTRYIRAMNIMIADTESVYVASLFNEDPDYFTLHCRRSEDELWICSESLPGGTWEKIPSGAVRSFR
ncbi:MAG: hypothetical protein HY695_12185 [Deltaproteobacteria bacterium]|nr:hypothetical protein [Deltaproteobacteria bacterium]